MQIKLIIISQSDIADAAIARIINHAYYATRRGDDRPRGEENNSLSRLTISARVGERERNILQ